MSYMHIENLYKCKDVLLFKECYAMEKIHGTSAHIKWKENGLHLYSGGVDYLMFKALFDIDMLSKLFEELGYGEVTVYGEAYGGKCQGMGGTYGKDLKFVVFEVKIRDTWLNVPNAENVTGKLQLDFVPYVKSSTDIYELNRLRDSNSVQAMKNGIDGGHKREGIVIRPLVEMMGSDGKRIIAKHKNDNFRETATRRAVENIDTTFLIQAEEIAYEWVTPMRLQHVLQKFTDISIEQTGKIIAAMIEDVFREGEGELLMSRLAKTAISRRTALLFKEYINNSMYKGDINGG